MGFGVLQVLATVCLSSALAGVVRNIDDYQGLEEHPCETYTFSGVVHLDCSNQGLTELPENLNYDAQILDLSYNNFIFYPTQLGNFGQMTSLDLSGNLLTEPLPLYFNNFTHLHTLNLSSNNYEYWIGNAHNSGVKVLDLSKNKIINIDQVAVDGMLHLTYLDLSENRIHEIPPRMFAKLNNLDTLILSRNYFSSVPKFQSTSLRTLHLSSCQILNLRTDSLDGMPSLLAVDLSINQIEDFPNGLVSNTLQELDLSYNEIGSLTDRTFSSLPHLAVLNLRGNEFREVWPTSHFASNPFLREVHVKGNRWSCEGFNVNLLLTYEFLAPKVSDEKSLICYSPANVTQLSWEQAYIQTWHSNETTETFALMAVMIGVIIGIVVTSLVCRALMALNKTERPQMNGQTTVNLNGNLPQPRVESVEIRVPLREEDLPPSYDEALLMPRLNSSFHSLPDFVDEESVESSRRYRRSRSIGDLTQHRPRPNDRRSVRRTVEIHISDS